jgi:hypothetical protein
VVVIHADDPDPPLRVRGTVHGIWAVTYDVPDDRRPPRIERADTAGIRHGVNDFYLLLNDGVLERRTDPEGTSAAL